MFSILVLPSLVVSTRVIKFLFCAGSTTVSLELLEQLENKTIVQTNKIILFIILIFCKGNHFFVSVLFIKHYFKNSIAFSKASLIPALFFPFPDAKKGCPPPFPSMYLPKSLITTLAFKLFSATNSFEI